jgi:hypothetical protein
MRALQKVSFDPARTRAAREPDEREEKHEWAQNDGEEDRDRTCSPENVDRSTRRPADPALLLGGACRRARVEHQRELGGRGFRRDASP